MRRAGKLLTKPGRAEPGRRRPEEGEGEAALPSVGSQRRRLREAHGDGGEPQQRGGGGGRRGRHGGSGRRSSPRRSLPAWRLRQPGAAAAAGRGAAGPGPAAGSHGAAAGGGAARVAGVAAPQHAGALAGGAPQPRRRGRQPGAVLRGAGERLPPGSRLPRRERGGEEAAAGVRPLPGPGVGCAGAENRRESFLRKDLPARAKGGERGQEQRRGRRLLLGVALPEPLGLPGPSVWLRGTIVETPVTPSW